MQASFQFPEPIRVATFNVSLSYSKAGQLAGSLVGGDIKARSVAAILRTVRPDIILLNEFDYDEAGRSIDLFRRKYLEAESLAPHVEPLIFPYEFTAPVNSGELSGMDLNKDGQCNGPEDAFGFGRFPGNFGMAILSRFPIHQADVRTFRKLRWKDLPNPSIPTLPETGKPWYSKDVWNRLRLSSKSHWVVPVQIGDRQLRLIACHPTPPAFEGLEKRNSCRNQDEIRLLAHLISGQNQEWLVDDQGVGGGLPPEAEFVVCGDLNVDPVERGEETNAIRELLQHPRVRYVRPGSEGAVEAAGHQGGANVRQKASDQYDTADFSDRVVGNLCVDYVIPSRGLTTTASGVFWPTTQDPMANMIGCSDHRLVWADLQFL